MAITVFKPINNCPVSLIYIGSVLREEVNAPASEDSTVIDVAINEGQIVLKVSFSISQEFLKPNNDGEKRFMKAVLKGLNQVSKFRGTDVVISEDLISEVIETYMQPADAKMILFVDTTSNIRLDTRWMSEFRPIQENHTSKLLDNLVNNLKLDKEIPERLSTKAEKNSLCKKIVSTLLEQLIDILKNLDSRELLISVMRLHERCIQKKEFREIQIPAQIACYSDYPTEVNKLVEDNEALVKVTIALRSLVEFIAAAPQFGNNITNTDDSDELLAIIDQLISWGMRSDAIELDIENPEIGLLPSGRIGTSKDLWNDNLKSFSKAKIENDLFEYQRTFEEKLAIDEQPTTMEVGSPDLELDAAFTDEFGLSVTEIFAFKHVLVGICMRSNNSVAVILENELKAMLLFELTGWNIQKIETALNLLSLERRNSITQAPNGYDKTDVYPWKYNRELSYLRKPLVKITRDGEVKYYWSFRHVYSTMENLLSLIYTGRLKAKDGGLLSKYISKINTEKGHKYRKVARDWFQKNTNLTVIPYEVKISPRGHLKADKDYGDIDLLVIDEKKKIIYPIECKNTLSARVVHEMKTELDDYLGRKGKSGMIQKHVDRDTWLKQNSDQLKQFVTNPEDYTIRSLVLTYEDIPVAYISKQILPLPLFSFKRLKREGAEIFEK